MAIQWLWYALLIICMKNWFQWYMLSFLELLNQKRWCEENPITYAHKGNDCANIWGSESELYWKAVLSISMKHGIHAQPMLLGMMTGDIKSAVVSKYISCPKFRAGMKAKSLKNYWMLLTWRRYNFSNCTLCILQLCSFLFLVARVLWNDWRLRHWAKEEPWA